MTEHEEKELVAKHEVALFGDGNGRKGVVDKIDEMYSIFLNARTFGKIIMYIIITIGTVSVALTQFKGFLMDYFMKK